MKRNILILSVMCILAGGTSCTRDIEPEIDNPKITISAAITGTRGILHPGDEGGSMQIMDYTKEGNNPEVEYIKNEAKYTTSDGGGNQPTVTKKTWNFPDNKTYSWMKEETGSDGKTIYTKIDHHFFSWLTADSKGLTAADLFGSGLSYSNKTLTVPATKMDLTTAQFDFCYSDMVNRLATRADYSPVQMSLHHLFTCFGVKAFNYTSDKITITSAKIYGVVNDKGCTISYNTTDGDYEVVYGTGANILDGVELVNGSIEMATNTGVENIITVGGGLTSATDAYYLMWPQTAANLNITTDPLVNTSGGVTAGSGQAFLVVGYKVNGGSTTTYKAIPLRPESWVEDGSNTVGWDAGTCHQLELAFSDTYVSLKTVVKPWDLYKPEIDYSGAVQVKSEGMLHFSGAGSTCTVDETNRRVYFKGGNPITFTFTIDAPLDATWMISMKGDYDAFEIDNKALGTYGDKINNATGTIDGNPATVTIYPKITDPDDDREIKLSFAVRASNGNVYSIDNLIQGNPETTTYYTIVLQAS